jgi:hypothetical protein
MKCQLAYGILRTPENEVHDVLQEQQDAYRIPRKGKGLLLASCPHSTKAHTHQLQRT